MKKFFTLFIAILMISTALLGYLPEPQFMSELTFLSNFIIGLLFLVSAVRLFQKKTPLPNVIFLGSLTTIMLVFLVCAGSLSGVYHMNFKGAYFFLHVVNPLLVLFYYFAFIRESTTEKKRLLFFVPLPAVLYLLMDYIVGEIHGSFQYGFFKPAALNGGSAFLILAMLYVILIALGTALFQINRQVHSKRQIKERMAV